jgi:NADH-quinone oxidoreductase subunit L
MEGPTPVSALIHAATMVTAGVFLLIRLSFLFEYVPHIQAFITYLGAVTAIFAAVVGLFQKDIKRIVAYSTCSQLGYMFMACGISVYSAALFHLVTHAFFKALLFLSAGSVIHAMSGEQNIRKMGGLYKQIPLTYGLVWIGSLALAGIPFFAGYFSKDWILEMLYIYAATDGSMVPYLIGILTSFLTAFYSWRLIYLVFHGSSKADERVQAHVHEAPLIMLIPKIILGVGAVFVGVGLSGFFSSPSLISNAYVFRVVEEYVPIFIHWLPVILAMLGIILALGIYHFYNRKLSEMLERFKFIARFIQSGFGIDEFYHRYLLKPFRHYAQQIYHYIEKGLIDKYGPNGLAYSVEKLGCFLRTFQTGRVGDYAIMMILGVILLLGYAIWVNK